MTLIGAAGPEARAAYTDIVTAMRRDFYSAEATRNDIRELYRRMVFNVFCNNSDDHLRNHGFLYPDGQDDQPGWRLSPVYDVVPQPVMDDAPRALHLSVGPDGRRATEGNVLAAARHFGLASGEAQMIVEEVRGTIRQNWETLHLSAGVPQRNLAEVRNCYALALLPDAGAPA